MSLDYPTAFHSILLMRTSPPEPPLLSLQRTLFNGVVMCLLRASYGWGFGFGYFWVESSFFRATYDLYSMFQMFHGR